MNTLRLRRPPHGRHWLGTLAIPFLFASLTAVAQTQPSPDLKSIEVPADEGPDPFEKPE